MATYTSPLGFPVMGIWPDFSTGTDINAVDASHSRRWLATSDDHGMVKLFNYPVVVEDAPHRAYRCVAGCHGGVAGCLSPQAQGVRCPPPPPLPCQTAPRRGRLTPRRWEGCCAVKAGCQGRIDSHSLVQP
jgi:hypothetical protein